MSAPQAHDPREVRDRTGASHPTTRCEACSDPECKGPEALRVFRDWNDLAEHLSEETIVGFVNELALLKPRAELAIERAEAQKLYHRKHQAKRAALLRAAREVLAPDELRALDAQALRTAIRAGRDEEDGDA